MAPTPASPSERVAYPLVLGLITLFLLAGLLIAGPGEAFRGFLLLQGRGSRLISDSTLIGGESGALLNAAIMGALALVLVRGSGVRLSGPTIASIFTVMGFSLFGKTPFNALPIILGVLLAARLAGKPFRNYIIMGLFGTSLGPLVDLIILESGIHGILAVPTGILAGVAAGILLPAVAVAMLRFHEGFSLYNIGLTSGFIGLFAAGILDAARHDVTPVLLWNSSTSLPFRLLGPVLAAAALLGGLAIEGRSLPGRLRALMGLPGRLPSDFCDMASPGTALANMGILGLLASSYLLAIGADWNGPTLGGLLTLMGFGAFGKHPRNCLPVMGGILGATLLFGMDPRSPGPLLAILFGTTLAPLAGEFGPFMGFAAGFLHLVIVDRSAAWHGGLALYNNGFAGGLVAALFVAVNEWLRSNGRIGDRPPPAAGGSAPGRERP